MSLLLVIPAIALLGLAAWRDVATRTIPDSVSVALAALGLAMRAIEGWQALAASLVVTVALLLLLLACHMRGVIGGGDVKLLIALALGLPPLGSYQLVVATAVAGGLLSILYLILPHLLPVAGHTRPMRCTAALQRIAAIEARRIRRRGPMPYGVAIAIGGALVLLRSPGG